MNKLKANLMCVIAVELCRKFKNGFLTLTEVNKFYLKEYVRGQLFSLIAGTCCIYLLVEHCCEMVEE